MATSTDLKQRAQTLAAKTDINSIDPQEVGGLFYDLTGYAEDVQRNGGSLGIRKVYASVSAMEADSTSPKDMWGNPMRKGQLCVIYDGTTEGADNNKIFAFKAPGWEIAAQLDAGYATRGELTELEGSIGVKEMTLTKGYNYLNLELNKDCTIYISSVGLSDGETIDVEYCNYTDNSFVKLATTLSYQQQGANFTNTNEGYSLRFNYKGEGSPLISINFNISGEIINLNEKTNEHSNNIATNRNHIIDILANRLGVDNINDIWSVEKDTTVGYKEVSFDYDMEEGIEYNITLISSDISNSLKCTVTKDEETIVDTEDLLKNSLMLGNNYYSLKLTPSSSGTYTFSFSLYSKNGAHLIFVISKQVNDLLSKTVDNIIKNEDYGLNLLKWYNAAIDGAGNMVYSKARITSEEFKLDGEYTITFSNNYFLYYRKKSESFKTSYSITNGGKLIISDSIKVLIAKVDGSNIYPSDIIDVNLKVNSADVSSKFEEINLSFENGSIDAAGENASSTSSIRTTKINTTQDRLYIFYAPEGFNIQVNYYDIYNSKRTNALGRFEGGFSIKGTGISNDYIRIAVSRTDSENPLQIENLTEEEKAAIHLYSVVCENKEYDVTIAEENSPSRFKSIADVVVDSNTCQGVINALFSCIDDIKVLIYPGNYYFSKVYTTRRSNQKCMIKTCDFANREQPRVTQIDGYYSARAYEGAAKLWMTEEGFNKFNDDEDNSMILVPINGTSATKYSWTSTSIFLNNITVIGYNYTKPIVFVNLSMARNSYITRCYVRGDNQDSGLYTFPTKPNENCVGIRVGYGSNSGFMNAIKNSQAIFCGKGISCCGEHYIFEDILTHHCYIGFAFGDAPTMPSFEHPNVMIGCSIEGCYRLMLLTKQGITEEQNIEDAYSFDNNIIGSSLICIGLSTEASWGIPKDEVVGDTTTQLTKPILEIIKGAYVGRIELDYSDNPFEVGSGKNMDFRAYTGYRNPKILEGRGNIVE